MGFRVGKALNVEPEAYAQAFSRYYNGSQGHFPLLRARPSLNRSARTLMREEALEKLFGGIIWICFI